MFVGHLGQVPLASASLAISFAGVTGFSLMLGMGGALETFCGQAYGAKLYHMLGVYMQRAMIISTLVGIPVSILWAFTGKILAILNQDPQISAEAGLYTRWLIPSIFPYAILQCQLRFLQAQNITLPLMISTGATTLFHVLVCWTLIFKFGLGNKGAALSNGISYWAIHPRPVHQVLSHLSRNLEKFLQRRHEKSLCFSQIGCAFCSYGLVSLVMPDKTKSVSIFPTNYALLLTTLVLTFTSLEFWSYEFLVIMSAFLPNPKLETSMMSISCGGCAVAVRNVWGYVYTNDKELVKYLASVMPILALSNFMDGIQGVLSGCARGCGWQKTGAFISLGAYYFVGLPSAIILTFLLHFGGKEMESSTSLIKID
ncbi:hypothetical protein Tsubulata_007128 [Turnera subulata]|uniref:Protein DETOXIFICATION n=1 Tax=Turnera subulata TaxID=218843 RepID=A0A9Q0GJU8_9ROSI|nr:hypothetical protein Tsubulata_007128 [Turnera subulata]